jgi:hypothetical protein
MIYSAASLSNANFGWVCHSRAQLPRGGGGCGRITAFPVGPAVLDHERDVTSNLQVGIVLIGKRHLGGSLHLLLVGLHGGLVNLDLWGSESRGGDKLLEGC